MARTMSIGVAIRLIAILLPQGGIVGDSVRLVLDRLSPAYYIALYRPVKIVPRNGMVMRGVPPTCSKEE